MADSLGFSLFTFFFLGAFATAQVTRGATSSVMDNSTLADKIMERGQAAVRLLSKQYATAAHKELKPLVLMKLTGVCGIAALVWYFVRLRNSRSAPLSQKAISYGPATAKGDVPTDAEETDPGLLKKHSEFKSYTTSRFTYPNLRIFYRKHPQAEKLPTTPAPLPLLVFIHGLGGSVAQFNPLLASLVNNAPCLAIDLPGCGLSSFEERSWDAYKPDALTELLAIIIEDYRDTEAGQGVVLIGHSMGCSLAALLGSTTAPRYNGLSDHVVGFVGICPKGEPPNEEQTKIFKKLLYIPGTIFDLWRRWDRRGGVNSASVRRFVGADASLETRQLQVRFNEQSRTPVWRRMASGTLPVYHHGKAEGGLPGMAVWAGLDVPVFLVAGEADHITKPEEVGIIAGFMGKSHPLRIEVDEEKKEVFADSAAPFDISKLENLSEAVSTVIDGDLGTHADEIFENSEPATSPRLEGSDVDSVSENLSIAGFENQTIPAQAEKPKKVLKTTILPAPANHALLYQPSSVRTLAGLVSDFLASHVSPRLSLGWQLQFLSTSGKWDVKNLAKWQAVAPVSAPIAGIFRAMKTLREVDDSHCPEKFVQDWGRWVKDIVDISHESPVYDPRGLEKGGVRYHKLPTVSKIPPTTQEVNEFIALIDRLREEQKTRGNEQGWGDEVYIGVHCHYGFNRTGFFIVCYLVEREGFGVQEALDEFAKKRPKGIKHAHFRDQLFVRYCKGLREAPTF